MSSSPHARTLVADISTKYDPPDIIPCVQSNIPLNTASTAVVPSHFSWNTSMDLPYILTLNSFALKRRTDIIAKVKRITQHMNLYDTVFYAIRKSMPKSYAGPHLSSILTVELIDSPCPSLTAPVLCYVFYVIITILFNDTCAYLIFFFFFNFNNSKEVS